ncbi:HSP70/90 co-chaperone [Malassezia yamatoensis]|uniref:HSP70/90 co-chaperone n=1 Tax=Malassezia yamatoensis TaxID=253288 RepID=A0AAJ6CF49_9BASI|nr:HSP70/90 co-chaperone [Malassezia yamatoensis]
MALDALQALAYEGHPDDTAKTFKEHGNDYFKAKRYKEALGFYHQGLEAKPGSKELLESLYLNCAACNHELENYGRALHDTRNAMIVNPRSLKALYRAIKAFLALDRLQDALGASDLARELGAEKDFDTLIQKVQDRAAALEKRKKEQAERERRSKAMKEAVRVACLARGLWIEHSSRQDDVHSPHFDPEALPANASLSLPLTDCESWQAPDPIRTPLLFPVVLMYPEHGTSDLIAEFHEDTTIGQHLDAMFPIEARGSLPWDTAGEYVSKNLSVIAVTHQKRLLRVGHKFSLRTFMDQAAKDPSSGKPEDRDGVVLNNGTISLAVFPKNSQAERTWLDALKAHKST